MIKVRERRQKINTTCKAQQNNMKKTLTITALFLLAAAFQFCNSSKKATAAAAPTFSNDIMPIMQASCTPCHFPPDGRKLPLNTLAAVKENIDHVLERVKLPKEDRRFMPMMNKKPALTAAQITILEQWKAAGMPE